MEQVKFIGLDSERLATMLKALSHPVRLEIVQILSDSGEANCVDFTRHAPGWRSRPCRSICVC